MSLPLLDLTIPELNNFVGSAASQMVGNNPLIAGVFLAIVFLVLAMKIGLGFEGSFVIGGFILIMITGTVALNTGNLLPIGVLLAFAIISGFIIFKAFRSDTFQ